ncbi:MAG: hypothetical protein WB816_00790 [Methylocystis sp.]
MIGILDLVALTQMRGFTKFGVGLAAAKEAIAQSNAFFVEGALSRLGENPLAGQGDPTGYHAVTKLLAFRDKHQAMELQDLGLQYGLHEIWSNLSKYADVEEPLEPPLIATAFSGCLNGYTIRSARRESAIIIDEQLVHIANLCGTLLSECFTRREAGRLVADFGIDRLTALLGADSPFTAKCVQALVAAVRGGIAAAAGAPDVAAMRDIMRDGFIHFVIAHEMAHVALNHYGDDDVPEFDDDDEYALFAKRHEFEFVADVFAIRACLRYILDLNPLCAHLFFAGAMGFLSSIEAFERILFQFASEGGDDEEIHLASGYRLESAVFPTTHPSPFVRRMRLRGFIANCALPSGLKVIFEETAAANEFAMERLTAAAAKAARLARRQGAAPHPIWLGRHWDYTLFNAPLADRGQGFGKPPP